MRNINIIASIVVLAVLATSATAQVVTIDFESTGLSEGDSIGPIMDSGVTVTLTSENQPGSNIKPLILAEAGNADIVAFQNVTAVGHDSPDGGAAVGGRYNATDGIGSTRDYIISFSRPVSNVTFDLYDFRGDGPHTDGDVGDTVSMSVNNGVLVPLYSLDGTEPDGNVIPVLVPGGGISSIRVDFDVATYGRDGGTSIDNLMFTVPEPSTATLGLLAVVSMLGLARRRG